MSKGNVIIVPYLKHPCTWNVLIKVSKYYFVKYAPYIVVFHFIAIEYRNTNKSDMWSSLNFSMLKRKRIVEISDRHLRRLISMDINVNTATNPPEVIVSEDDLVSTIDVKDSENFDEETKSSANSSCKSDFETVYSDSSLSCDESNSSVEVCDEDNSSGTFNIKTELAEWAIECGISHIQCTKLLKKLKKHKCFSDLPGDSRSLLHTPRSTVTIPVSPGHYTHFGVYNGLLRVLELYGSQQMNSQIDLSVNIDGLPLTKSSGCSLWPILCSLVNHDEVFVIGAFYGSTKPSDVNEFLRPFVTECLDLFDKGIDYNGKHFTLRVKNLICDVPAKAYVLNVKGHSGYSSCPRCKIVGSYLSGRLCFPDEKVMEGKRTDGEFREKVDDEYHLPGQSLLTSLPNFDMVQSIPFDYMHLVCLGVMKKLLVLWISGDLKFRLPSRKIEEMSQTLERLKKYTPSEFSRKPRSLRYMKLWKATEFRQFLLYTGYCTTKIA